MKLRQLLFQPAFGFEVLAEGPGEPVALLEVLGEDAGRAGEAVAQGVEGGLAFAGFGLGSNRFERVEPIDFGARRLLEPQFPGGTIFGYGFSIGPSGMDALRCSSHW
jgi:hypothetical protein